MGPVGSQSFPFPCISLLCSFGLYSAILHYYYYYYYYYSNIFTVGSLPAEYRMRTSQKRHKAVRMMRSRLPGKQLLAGRRVDQLPQLP